MDRRYSSSVLPTPVGPGLFPFLRLLGLGLCAALGCSLETAEKHSTSSTLLRLATTTSTRDSGLLDVILPAFEAQQGCRVDVVAIGTGAALKLGERGDADVLIVHARSAEREFMEAGHGKRHEEFMYNAFVVLGPKEDPARIRGLEPAAAFMQIREMKQPFVSRGDESGTHRREMVFWEESGGMPSWVGYIESGQGMGPTLIVADETEAYVLTDEGTYLNFRDKIELVPLVENTESLRNPYAVIAVDVKRDSRGDTSLADAFVDFLISAEAQQLIASYQISGQTLFHPTRQPESD